MSDDFHRETFALIELDDDPVGFAEMELGAEPHSPREGVRPTLFRWSVSENELALKMLHGSRANPIAMHTGIPRFT
jgi:hypothetical protein